MFEHDVTVDPLPPSCGRHGRRDDDRLVDQLENPLGRRHRRLQDVELLRHVADRPEEAQRVLQERDERAKRERVPQDAAAAIPDDQRRRQRAHDLDGRIEDRIVEDGIDVRVPVLPIDLVEAPEVQRLAPEQLDGRHACDVFLQERVDARDPPAHDAVRIAHVSAEPLRDEDDQRQHREGDQRQLPVHPQHHAHDADEREHIAENRDHARREQIVQHVDIRGDARHQASDGVPVVILQIEPLQVPVNRHPQVEHDSLAGQLHRPRLHVLGDEGAGEDGQIQRRQPIEAGEPAGRDVTIDGQLDQVRLRELRGRPGNNRDERNPDLTPVRAQVRQETPHQPGVVRLAEDLVFVHFPPMQNW